MHEQQAYEIVGIGEEPVFAHDGSPVRAFLAQFREHLSNPERAGEGDERLRSMLDAQLRDAYRFDDAASLHALHLGLNEILFRQFNHARNHVERSALMFEIQQRMIDAQLEADLRAIKGEPLPESADEFERWFNKRCVLNGRPAHPLFDFLETQANAEQFRRFIEIEAGVHVAFDDVLSLAQVGVRGMPRGEFLRNLEDEVGGSDASKFHLAMFERVVAGLGIRTIRRLSLPWEALACGNYLMFLAYFRCFHRYCIGYLGCLEAMTPDRFGRIARGGVRLGIAPVLLKYHAEHSTLDENHTQGWLRHVLLPVIREHGAPASRDIARGVRLRERVAKRYWDAVLNELAESARSLGTCL